MYTYCALSVSRSLTFSVGVPPRISWRQPPACFALPGGPSLLFRKEAKETQGLRPYVPAKGKGRVTTVLHLILRTGAKTLTPDVIVLSTPMVKGGGGAGGTFY